MTCMPRLEQIAPAPFQLRTWTAPAEVDLRVCESVGPEFGQRHFTFECWFEWLPDADGAPAQSFARYVHETWQWTFGFDQYGAMTFRFSSGSWCHEVRATHLLDQLRPGRWYHAAVVFFDTTFTQEAYSEDYVYAGLYLTGLGEILPRSVASDVRFRSPHRPPSGAGKFEITPEMGAARIRWARFSGYAMPPGDFTALGSRELPRGIETVRGFADESIGRLFEHNGQLVFTETPQAARQNSYYSFRLWGGAGKELEFASYHGNPMASLAFISEDGGATWQRPSEGVTRQDAPAREGKFTFRHRFVSDRAWIASAPIVSRERAERWIETMAAVLPDARVHKIGCSERGFQLRVIEIGEPSAPLVYLQGGQHSMAERYGFVMMAALFEAAAKDREFLRRHRVAMLPIVNVDSPYTTGTPQVANMNRLWGTGAVHANVNAIERFLECETNRTGGVAMFDWHTGGGWENHTLCAHLPPAEKWERAVAAENLRFSRREWTKMPRSLFGNWASALPGVRLSLTVELALVAAHGPSGQRLVTDATMREDGATFFAAIKRWRS